MVRGHGIAMRPQPWSFGIKCRLGVDQLIEPGDVLLPREHVRRDVHLHRPEEGGFEARLLEAEDNLSMEI